MEDEGLTFCLGVCEMRIQRVRLHKVSAKMRDVLKMSIGSVECVDHVVVEVISDTGLVGIGEAAAENGPIFSEEFSASIYAVIDQYVSPRLIGRDPLDFAVIQADLEASIKGNWFAKSAVEMGLLDLVGKAYGVPIWRLFGGLVRDRVPLAYGAHSMELADEITQSTRYVERGWTIIKLKAGVLSPAEDIRRVREIRKAVGSEVRIIVDANQGWTPDVAIRTARAMEEFDIAAIEQPVPRHDIRGMARLAAALDVPVMADESVFSPEDAVALIVSAAADVFSVKISKSGGIQRARKIAAIAEAAGIPCYVGSMAEYGIGAAAALQFAGSTPNVTFGCEVAPPYDDDIVEPNLRVDAGFIYVPSDPGLGVLLDPGKLARHEA